MIPRQSTTIRMSAHEAPATTCNQPFAELSFLLSAEMNLRDLIVISP
jgi:hypothetical protein